GGAEGARRVAGAPASRLDWSRRFPPRASATGNLTVSRRSLFVALLLTACATPPSGVRAPPSAAEDYYPLAVGNHWTYSVNFLGDRRERRVEIIGHRDGYYLDNEGGQLTVDGLGVRDQKRYLLREPIRSGASWTNVVSASSVEHYQ